MENKYKYLIKNTSFLTLSNFSSKILVFLLVPLYTNILSTWEYGFYDLISTSTNLLIPILSVNIVEGVSRFALDKDLPIEDVASVGGKYVVIGVVIFCTLIGLNSIVELSYHVREYSIFICAYFGGALFNQYAIHLAKGLEKFKAIAIAGVLGTVFTVVLNLLLIWKFRLKGFYSAYIIGQMISAVYLLLYVKIWKLLLIKPNKKIQKEMIKYSIPLIMNSLGWWINNVSDRYVVTAFCGLTINGIYSIAYKIPTIMNTIQAIFVQSWQISAVKEYNLNGAKEFYINIFNVTSSMMCVVGTILIAFTRHISYFVFSRDFYDAWIYVPFLLISSIINTASGVIGPILTAKKKSKSIAISALYGAGVNIGLNLLLIYFLGAQGAAIATAIASYVIFFYRKKAVGTLIDSSEYNKIILSWLVLVVQSVVLIKDCPYGLQIILIFIIFLLNYRSLILIVKFLKKYICG